MSMGAPFNPNTRTMKELSRRAKAELDRHGVEGVAARGTTEPTKSVTKG